MTSFAVEADAISGGTPESVWAILADGRNWSSWNPRVRWMVVEGPLAPGSFLTIQPARGRQTAYTIEAAEPASRLRFAIRFGPMGRVAFDYRIVAEGNGSRISGRAEISGVLQSLLVRAAGKQLAESVPAFVSGLARAAEASASAEKR